MVLFIIVLYLIIVVRTLLRLMRERDPFIRLAGTGLACIFGVQAFINLGVAVRLLPAKGMTLPFVKLWRFFADCRWHCGGHAVGVYAHARSRRNWRSAASPREMNTKPRLLLLAAGGTGGHMFPAQALSEAMLAKGWRVKLSTDRRGARYTKGFPSEVEIEQISASTFARGGFWAKLIVPFVLGIGVLNSLFAMQRDRPDVVVGFGGYPSIPALAAAWLLRRPRIIHEQNGVLGRVNQLFAKHVNQLACGSWPTATPAGVTGVHTGNPVRSKKYLIVQGRAILRRVIIPCRFW